MTRFRLLCSSEHVIGHQEISFLASVMLMHCFSVNAQLLEHSSTSFFFRARERKSKLIFIFCSAATGPEICAQCLQWAGYPASLELPNPAISQDLGSSAS
jgi:hypothetical protein